MKLAIIRGTNLNQWEMQFYSKLRDYNIHPTAIASTNNQFDLENLEMPIVQLDQFRKYNKVPGLSQGLGYLFCFNEGFLKLSDTLKGFDVVNTVETYNTFSNQAINSGKPVVVTSWETIPFNNERTRYKQFKKNVRNKAKHFIAISTKAKNALIKEGVHESKISIIPAGLDTKRFAPEDKDKKLIERFELNKDKKNVLFVGRLELEKGVLDLVKAMTNLDAVLLIAGKGPLKEKIKTLAKENNVQIKFLDFISYNDMPKVHNLADVFCLPSIPNKKWEEQFGYVLVEAMSCGKPVVSTNCGAIPELVNDERVLTQPENPAGLHHLLKTVLDNESLRTKLGEKNRKRALEVYDNSVVAKQLSEVFKSIT